MVSILDSCKWNDIGFFYWQIKSTAQIYYSAWGTKKERKLPMIQPYAKFNRSSKIHILHFSFALPLYYFHPLTCKYLHVKTYWRCTCITFYRLLCFNKRKNSNAIDSSNEAFLLFLKDDDITNCLIYLFGILSHFFLLL